MRIDNIIRTGAAGARGTAARSAGSGAVFHVDDGSGTARAAGTAPSAATQGIGALLALQAVDDPLLKRKKLVRRGIALLDTLEAINAELLLGQAGEGRLSELVTLIGQAREGGEPGLDGLLDDIELRARVELAKRGVFPAF